MITFIQYDPVWIAGMSEKLEVVEMYDQIQEERLDQLQETRLFHNNREFIDN